MVERNVLNIIFIYCTENYPNSFSANNTKISFIAESLMRYCNQCTIVNNPKFNIGQEGNYVIHGFNVINIKSGWRNKYKKLHTILKESYDNDKKNFVIISCGSIVDHVNIFFLAKLYCYKIGYIYQEWHYGLESTLKGKINAVLNDKILIRYYDFILPISEFLIDKIKKYEIPYFKLPIIDRVPTRIINENQKCYPYFVYCASIIYKSVIEFVLKSFDYMEDSQCKLVLVLSGSEEQLENFKLSLVKYRKFDKIEVYSKIPYEDLKKIYRNACALLIPLIPGFIPDVARFSQKTAEYLSSGRPILTTPVGEMNYYFKDGETAYFADYDEIQFSKRMKYICDHRDEADIVGKNGMKLAKSLFDVDEITDSLRDFLCSEIR